MAYRFAPAAMRVAIAAALAVSVPAQASIVLDNTRVVYHAPDAEATVRLTNGGSQPALAQVWIDAGDAAASPAAIDVPFVVTPPIARIDPGKGQTLRIVYAGDPLPGDRESLFFLNVLEVPPRPTGDAAQGNLLYMAFRTRIKLFFRPAKLAGSAAEAPAHVTWRVARVDGRMALEATNPTPYHVTLVDIGLTNGDGADGGHRDDGRDDPREPIGGMLAPGESRRFPLDGARPAPGTRVRFGAINDYGGTSYLSGSLSGSLSWTPSVDRSAAAD
ncbi:fimbrial biogenesis chaperone [Cupriavidus plantarum]|uniref:fimbrial biogenesis chaperone n=1 Tax=Cupriavidus plantarum TaxID=942865 RepID=UPI000E22F241|nr:fimbria/pilus periplasmic chaperone [Cupriavidus plantarum]